MDLDFLCIAAEEADLPTPKRQKMRDPEPRAAKSSEKWMKSREMF